VNDPVGAVQSEQVGFARLRSALEGLRNVLAAGGIDLKESRIRNALKTISEICSSTSLETLRESFVQLQLQHHASLSSKEATAITEKRHELTNREQQVLNERSRLESDIHVLRTRRHELSLRVTRLKADLEQRIESTGEEAVEIVLDN
jgi:ribosomal protein S13